MSEVCRWNLRYSEPPGTTEAYTNNKLIYPRHYTPRHAVGREGQSRNVSIPNCATPETT